MKMLQQTCHEIWSPDNSKPNTHYLCGKTSRISFQRELIFRGQIMLSVCVVQKNIKTHIIVLLGAIDLA